MIDVHDWQSHAYWQPLRRRLEALGADIEDDGLGTWMDAVDDAFGPAQRLIGLRACHTAPPAERWLLVNGWGASQALLDGEPLRVADSLTDALACILTQAIELRELPDDVSIDQNAAVRLARAGRLLVEVRRWQPPPTPSAQAELAARTLFDLRRSPAPFFELVERLQRWPGLPA
jgi:hypothetical protein